MSNRVSNTYNNWHSQFPITEYTNSVVCVKFCKKDCGIPV